MKVLDRYILKTFVVSLFIVMAAMMGIALLLDLFFNYKQLLHTTPAAHQAGFWSLLWGIGNFYFYKSFSYFQLLAAPSLQVAAAAALVRLHRGRELVGIKAAGISLYRVMWPMIALSLVVDGFYVLNQEVIIPSIAVELSRTLDDLEVHKEFAVEFVRDDINIIYAPKYLPDKQEMVGIDRLMPDGSRVLAAHILIWLRNPKFEARATIEADSAQWDPKQSGWRLTNGLRRMAKSDSALIERVPTGPEGVPVDFYASKVGPRELQRHRIADFYRFMSYSELSALVDDPMRGNRRQLQVTLHQHVTSPIMNILILLLGLPFVTGREDRNYFTSIGISIVLVIGIFALTFAATAFGSAGHISPLLAAWIPIFVVLPAAILSM